MNCCADCSQGFDCGSGMYGLMGALVAAGSEVKVGFAYNLQTTSEEAFQGYGEPSYIQEVLKGALLGSGAFQYVTVIVNPVASLIQNGYILIQGTLYTDRPYVEEIGDLANDIISEYLPTVVIKRRDPVHVLSVPANRPGVQQVFDPTQQANSNKPPGKCSWETQSIGDYLSCQLGLDTKTSVGIGAIGALAVVVVAVALLKR